MSCLLRAGMSAEAVLLATTHGNANLLGLADEIGTVEPGKHADLVLLDGSPLDDMARAGTVRLVVQGGRLLYPESLLPSSGNT